MAKDEDPPPANLSNIVFMVPFKEGLAFGHP